MFFCDFIQRFINKTIICKNKHDGFNIGGIKKDSTFFLLQSLRKLLKVWGKQYQRCFNFHFVYTCSIN